MIKKTMKFKYLDLSVFWSCLLLAALAGGNHQAHALDFFSPRSAGIAGSGIAGPLLNDSLFMNPSYASFLPTYAVGLTWATYGSQDNPIHGRAYSVSVQDGRNSLFQAGLAYTVRQDHSFIHLGASKSFIQNWGVGLSGKFFFNSPNKTNGQELSLSSTYVFSPWIQTAVVVDNLLGSAKGRPAGLYREFKAGAKFNIDKILLVYLDPHYVPDLAADRFGHSIGIEFVMMRDLFLRIGNYRNANVPHLNLRGDGYGFGLGWVAPRISIDYGISRTVDPVSVTTHIIGATSFF